MIHFLIVFVACFSDFTSVNDTFKTTSPLEIDMIKIEGGTFQMGNKDGRNDEKPTHSVALKSFSIGKFEVTQEQWVAIMD